MGKSIMHDKEDGCLICGNPYVECHHVCFGRGRRQLSDKYGLTVYLCHEHHRGNLGVHFNPGLDHKLKQMAQRRFEEVYNEDFVKVFGRNYL